MTNRQIDESTGGYEHSDAKPGKIIVIALVSIALIVVSVIGLNELFISMRESMTLEMVLKPESPALRDLRAREEGILNSYAIVDSAAGVVRIPIKRAMELEAREAAMGRLDD